MSCLRTAFQKLAITELKSAPLIINPFVRYFKFSDVPQPGKLIAYRRRVNYPEKYTIKPLTVRNLGGRDPVTGRKVCEGIGGGIKHKYHWIDWNRVGPTEGPPLVEKVLKVLKDGNRTAFVALVGVEDRLKYILATENMKEGDLIKTSMHIPRIPVKANEGDAYPLGALPLGTQVHCIEKKPGSGGFFVHAAGSYGTITRKTNDNLVVVQLPSKREFMLPEKCMCTVGRLSNVEHGSTPIGSAQRSRELGNRPRSGWWHRKTGRHGRKIRRPPPVQPYVGKDPNAPKSIQLTLPK